MNKFLWTCVTGLSLCIGLSLDQGEAQPPAKIGGKLYVTSWFGDWISVVDLDAGKVTGQIKVGMKNHNVYLSPDQKFAWVTNNNANTVSIIDTATDKVVDTLKTGQGPRHTFFSSDGGTAYVTNEFDDAVAVLDPVQRKVLAQVRVG